MSVSLPKGMSNPVAVLADDDAGVRGSMVDLLDHAGFQVLEACNAAEALQLLRACEGIDALLTDVSMPGAMNGRALAKLARRCWPHLAIIVMSGQPLPLGEELPERAVFQQKPVNTHALIAQLRVQMSVGRSLRAGLA